MSTVREIHDLGLFRIIAQPNLNFVLDRNVTPRLQFTTISRIIYLESETH